MDKALSRLQTSGYIAHKQNALGFDVFSHVPLLASWQKASNSKFVIWNISHLHFFLCRAKTRITQYSRMNLPKWCFPAWRPVRSVASGWMACVYWKYLGFGSWTSCAWKCLLSDAGWIVVQH